MPLWMRFVKRYGKRKVWLCYSFLGGFTNFFYVFVGEGDIELGLIITFLNGLPLGGKFIADSILADTIDYDEFRSGERREAQFTMFASFIPKAGTPRGGDGGGGAHPRGRPPAEPPGSRGGPRDGLDWRNEGDIAGACCVPSGFHFPGGASCA